MEQNQIVGPLAVLAYTLVAYLAGGGTMLLAVGMLAKQILNSPVLISAVENLARNASPELLQSLNDMGKLIEEATDSVPAAEKLPQG